MLLDLTTVSNQRVSQVDELRLGSRHWVRSSDLAILGVGMVVGVLIAMPLRIAFGGIWMFLLAPVCGIVALVLFSRKRSVQGERGHRKIDRLLESKTSMHGMFVMPGDDGVFDPNGFDMIEVHDHPVYPMEDV